jgi:3-dehydroquinate dehydratase-1
MQRRNVIKTGLGALAGTFVSGAFASTKLKGTEKMMPVETLNSEPGWVKGPVEVLEIKGVRIGEGRPKVIASTTAKTPEAFIALVKDYNARPELDMIELRPDYVGDINGKDFAKLTLQVYEIAKNKPILMTFRDKTEGGGRHVSDEYYRDFYFDVLDNGKIDLLDIEQFRNADICKQIVKKCKEKGVKVVMSDHEFGWTPTEAEIIRRLQQQEALGSDILKIAVMAHNTGDALALMGATWKMRHYYSRKPMLTMAMGKWGVMSRITGEFTGSDITFCMVGGKPSAPGQIPTEEANQILNSIHKAMYPSK